MPVINRKVDYALLILSYLSEKNEGDCARAVADWFGLSRAFVANILKTLCQKGFVASHRGVKGGYVLQRPPAEIKLADLMEAFDDPFCFAECNRENVKDPCPGIRFCTVKEPLAEVHGRLKEVLHSVTLASLLHAHHAKKATANGESNGPALRMSRTSSG